MFYRTIRMMENGIKPVFVFDGKPPQLKSDELQKRTDRRAENEILLTEAKDKGDATAVEKFERRLVKVLHFKTLPTKWYHIDFKGVISAQRRV